MLVLVAAAAIVPPDAVRSAPPAVRRFIERRARCTHWAGEEPYDRERADEIDHALSGLRCDRLDADDAALRRRYAARRDLLRLLTATADSLE